MGFLDKIRGQVGKHGDTIAGGLDKAAKKANEATKGKYAGQIDKGVTQAKKGIDNTRGPGGQGGAPPPTPPTGPPAGS